MSRSNSSRWVPYRYLLTYKKGQVEFEIVL
jgi:hypothetical protein